MQFVMVKLKNTYTEIPASKSINKIEERLLNLKASKILKEYEELPGLGNTISKLSFIITLNDKEIPIQLPSRVKNVYRILFDGKRIIRSTSESKRWQQANNVAWRNIDDWLYAQLTLIQIEQAEFLEVFLPYVMTSTGLTFYEKSKSDLLGLPYNN